MALTDDLELLIHANADLSDSSPNGNDGVATGATINTTDQKLGAGCIEFAGGNDVVTIPNEGDYTFLTDNNPTYSMGLWFDTVDSSSALITKMNQAAPAGIEFRVRSGKLQVVHVTNGSNFEGVTCSTTITDGAYHAGIVNCVAGVISVHLDNVAETLTPFTVGAGFSGGANGKEVLLGARWNGSSKETFYDGLMDEIFIRSAESTAEDMTKYWNFGAGKEIGVGGGRRRRLEVMRRGYA